MDLVWLKFAICVAVILLAGRQVARYGDVIAEKTGLGGAWVGVVLVAVTTSLPELFTGISSVTLAAAPALTVGNLLGANTFNLFNLALLDIAYRRGPLLTAVGSRHLLSAGLGLVLVAFVADSLLISKLVSLPAIGWVGVYTPVIFLLYLHAVRVIFNHERAQSSAIEAPIKYGGVSLKQAYQRFAVAALFISGAGVWLALVGKEMAEVTGLTQGFVGTMFLGFSTSLPEITVSFAALRLGACDLCVGNMMGSNLFNMAIIGIDDLFYTEGPILDAVSQNHILTALVVILMTSVVIVGLIRRPQRKTPLGASSYSLALIALFLLGVYARFAIS